MKIQLLRTLFLLTFLLAANLWADYQVTKIDFRENVRLSDQELSEAASLKPGSLSAGQIRTAIKNIYKLGGIDNIEADLAGTTLILNIKEQPFIRKIYIKGNEKGSLEQLSKILNSKENPYFDPLTIKQQELNTRIYYQTLGFIDADILSGTEEVSPGQVDLTFTINEGQKFKIEDVIVKTEGNVDGDDLADVLRTKRYKWWNSWLYNTGRLNEAFLEADKTAILQRLLDLGYINAQVEAGKILREDTGLQIVFNVREGEPFDVGKVSVSGDLLNNSYSKTVNELDLSSGEIFNASKIRQEALNLADVFGNVGYAFANVVPETNVQLSSKTVDLNFKIDQGKLTTVNEVKISGNNKTYDNVIRRELKVDEQERFSRKDVKRSEAKLRRTGYFEDVSITPEPVAGSDELIDLDVKVKEGSTGAFSVGGGFASGDGALFNVRLSENNFLGTGRRVTVNADIGNRTDNLVFAIDDPRFNDSFWRVGFQAFKRERRFEDFDRSINGAGFLLGYPLEEFYGEWANDLDFSVRYQFQDISIEDIELDRAAQFIRDSAGDTTASSVTPRLVRNTINNPLTPTDGSRQIASVEYAGLGGDEEFYLLEASNELFTPLIKGDFGDSLVFSWRTSMAYGETTDDDPFPLFRRFFPGGINSVRGYEVRSLGPRDENGSEFGGSKQFINNLELIFPLSREAQLRGVVFYDLGEAFDDEESINLGELRAAAGFGFRWNSPIAPLRVEFGFPLDKEDGDDGFVTQFSFGAPLF